MKFKHIVIHYSEISLKGANRGFFENTLRKNIEKALKREGIKFYLRKISGRFVVELNEEIDEKSEEYKKISEILRNVIGIANFSYAIRSDCSIEAVKDAALFLLSKKDFNTFRISAVRADKKFMLTSQQVNEIVGEHIAKNLNKKVSLKNFDVEVVIEITDKDVFLYTERFKGISGLPVGVSGNVVSLISGGIDSAVSSFYAMKRGCNVIFIHFYSGIDSIEKIKKIVKILNKFQFESKIYFIPFGDLRAKVLENTSGNFERYRVVIGRRFMLRIAEKICEKENCLAIITGDSIGQVASQTLENIKAINEVCKIPILRPLIGFDKEEIVNKAKEIGSYEISILPHEDVCASFAPRHPATNAKIEIVKEIEKNLDVEILVNDAIKNLTIEEI